MTLYINDQTESTKTILDSKVFHKLEFNDTSELIQKTEDGNKLISLEFCSTCDKP